MYNTAYDYDKQTWVEGKEARQLLHKQITEELELLMSYKGKIYANSVGKDYKLAIKDCHRVLGEIARLG